MGEFKNYSISWSQANVEEYEKEFTPRHLLEWNVIKFYKEIEFDFTNRPKRFVDLETGEKVDLYADNVRVDYKIAVKKYFNELERKTKKGIRRNEKKGKGRGK